ncbi:hypothetical protein ACGFI3_20160 [Nonomuraea wenchangensis]|uniref:hypothetical protein n=1 Tax=Nonomuraea wenchangensis TaxID=568860 RepID=UPI0037106426
MAVRVGRWSLWDHPSAGQYERQPMSTQHAVPEPVIGKGFRAARGTGPVTHPGSAQPSRPLAVGYVRLRPGPDTAECDNLAESLRGFAARVGLDMVDIYTDRHAYRRPAFGELLQALCRPEVNAVIIPTPEHLSEFDGIYQAMRALIEIETGADVLVMSQNDEADDDRAGE